MFRKPSILLNIILPLLLAVAMLYAYKNSIGKAADIGLGKGTTSYFPEINNYPIHITDITQESNLETGWKARGGKELILWLGNSQLHGVNQYVNGNKNTVAFIFDNLSKQDKDIVAVSYPNANLQEFLVSVLYFSRKVPLKKIILPVFFDDMREDGIRVEINLPQVIGLIKNYSVYFNDIESIHQMVMTPIANVEDGKNDFSGIKETLQDVSERMLNEKADSLWSIWRARADIRGNLFNDMYKTRNTMLGITATSIRKMIPGRYEQNYSALKQILQYCKDKGIKLYIYVPPIRDDVSLPYDLTEYASFKTNLEKDVNSFGHHFTNLEKLVPPKYWGMKESTNSFGGGGEIDFMHFQEAGHRLLADTMFQVINKSK